MARRRAAIFAVLGSFAFLMIAGAVLFTASVASRPDSSAYTCPEPAVLAPLDPTFGSLPPLEMVRVDFPTSRVLSGVWRHWDGGILRVQAVSFDPGGDTLWLGLTPGLARLDLNALCGEFIDVGRVIAVDSIVPVGPEQFWAIDTVWVVRYDRGSREVLSGSGSHSYVPLLAGGLDKQGALWVKYTRCKSFPIHGVR